MVRLAKEHHLIIKEKGKEICIRIILSFSDYLIKKGE